MPVDESLERGFVHVLVEDVTSALSRAQNEDTESHRREAVRTMFAAIEGLAWVYREHVRKAAHDLGYITPLLDLALREKTYIVSEQGEVVEQTRFNSLPTMIRLTSRIAEKAHPPFKPDFGHVGWSKLKQAVSIRNRLVHPKSMSDLSISADEIFTAKRGFFWLLALVIEGMSAANTALTRFADEAHELLDALKSGDPQALADYQEAIERG